LFADAGLKLEDVRVFERAIDLQAWLDRAGCTGKDAERVRALMAGHVDGDRIRLDRIALKGVHA
jgi:hypothetical protein